MSDIAAEFEELKSELAGLASKIDRVQSVNVNAAALKGLAKQVSQRYFRSTRAALEALELSEEAKLLDESFESILKLSDGNNAAKSYKRELRVIRKIASRISVAIEARHGAGKLTGTTTADDKLIIETLSDLIPNASLSYQQALIDLNDEKRVSYRGPALDLREALRETLDHLAPDADVMGRQGFKLEKDRTGPTMKQKVNFILTSRGEGRTSSEAPTSSAATVDEMVGALARSVYNSASLAAHVSQQRKKVVEVKRYVAAVLHTILEI